VGIIYNIIGNITTVTISILFDGENISLDANLVMYINCTSIPPIIIINRIYKNQNLLYIVPLIRHFKFYSAGSPCESDDATNPNGQLRRR
jgi:hypothetical protein